MYSSFEVILGLKCNSIEYSTQQQNFIMHQE